MDGCVLLALWLAAGGDERLERQENLKTMVSGMEKKVESALQLKMVMLWNEIFLAFVKIKKKFSQDKNCKLIMNSTFISHVLKEVMYKYLDTGK